mmetsp:Transcript_6806/g.16979  ORF Transcript_6806/g.16979 Transcript_6806/m.16979 type:complete len:155 (-) Transcript_6806:348-812(-)|eukprot:CAMPEP_0202865808 /NCGR_PEP_ID=MMETSP1391-20130828/6375_1 /ASSEMBLY_ACC=CAM_ASM_000867 /TAXON_ID=1034604 /ORGANISM="Chlamydomonas leiostraca, Strain SAG 11-49" /LENGTH=154 /DNA_ID=CAMNT_0049545685 /DNA_START=40 /DNA_END=504 /DNA_ORIENTATION=-
MMLVRQSAATCTRVRNACARVTTFSLAPVHCSISSQQAMLAPSHPTPSSSRVASIPSQRGQVQCFSASKTPEADDVVELEIKVAGMMCEGCTSRVQEALQKAAPQSKVTVSLEKAMASVEVKAPSQLDALNQLPKLVETVKALGFEAEPHIAGL